MPKVPLYNPTQGARTSPVVMNSPEVAAVPARALGGLGETVGQAGGLLVKLQEQRNIRLNNIEAINLFNEYNEQVRGLTDSALQKQGSDAMNLYDGHVKSLQEASKTFMDRASNDRVRDMFTEHAYQASEASKNQIAAHQRQQEKVARDQAIENLVESHIKAINDTPENEAGLSAAIEAINKSVDLQYPEEQASEIRDKASARLKSEYLLSMARVNANGAKELLEAWQDTGTFDAKTYEALKNHIEQTSKKASLDDADAALMAKFKSGKTVNWAAAAHDVAVNYKAYGLTVDQAEALSSRYEGHSNFEYSLSQRGKEEGAKSEIATIFQAYQSGNQGQIDNAFKIIADSKKLSFEQRINAMNALNGVQAQNVYDDILSGKIKSLPEVQLATLHMGSAGREVVNYFKNRKAADDEAIKQSVDLYREHLGKNAKGGLKFKLPDDVFKLQVMAQINEKNIHGAEILEWTKRIIGYKEDTGWGTSVRKSPWKDWEENPKTRAILERGSVKSKDDKKNEQGAASKIGLLDGYDKAAVEQVRGALKNAYPNRAISDHDIERTLILNGVKRNGTP